MTGTGEVGSPRRLAQKGWLLAAVSRSQAALGGAVPPGRCHSVMKQAMTTMTRLEKAGVGVGRRGQGDSGGVRAVPAGGGGLSLWEGTVEEGTSPSAGLEEAQGHLQARLRPLRADAPGPSTVPREKGGFQLLLCTVPCVSVDRSYAAQCPPPRGSGAPFSVHFRAQVAEPALCRLSREDRTAICGDSL